MLNPAAWTHYSYALRDACAQRTAPLVEVHISDPKAGREEFRHHSVITAYAAKEIVGQGIDGYHQALEFLRAQVSLPRGRSWAHSGQRHDPGSSGPRYAVIAWSIASREMVAYRSSSEEDHLDVVGGVSSSAMPSRSRKFGGEANSMSPIGV